MRTLATCDRNRVTAGLLTSRANAAIETARDTVARAAYLLSLARRAQRNRARLARHPFPAKALSSRPAPQR